MSEKRESLNKTVAVVIKDDNRLSKHSSITSEVDLVVAETSISEAKVESVSKETFVVLEPGSTMKLSIDTAKNTVEVKAKGENKENSQVNGSKTPTEMEKVKNITEVKNQSKIKGTENIEESDKQRNSQKVSLDSTTVAKIETNSKYDESSEVPNTDKNVSSLHDQKYPEDRSYNGDKNEKNDTKESCDAESKEQSHENTKYSDPYKEPVEQVDPLKGQVENRQATSENDQKSGLKGEKTDRTDKAKEETETEVINSHEQTQVSTALVPIDEVRTSNALLPETVALVAKQLTTTLAKQMVQTTTTLGREMIGTPDNLTIFNGSTLELADVDYFVIYKADSQTTDDGIKFIARMELGTNAITSVIPFSSTKAWVSYFGGGIKLIDIEKECTVNKIDMPGLDSIATTDENYLYTSSCLTHSAIDKMHIVGEGETGTMSYVKFTKSRIACMTMSKAGDKMIVCIEKQHSFLCFPGKSEINVQIYGLRGRRMKELRPKVDGTNRRTTYGFPIGMCENTNKDICISSFNSADHTCAVEVFDKNLERRFIYNGEKKQTQKFMCEDICTDGGGNILMLDNSLKSVHIVTSNGEFIKMISTAKYQIENPKCINVDPAGRLWIGQGPPAQMIILEYSLK